MKIIVMNRQKALQEVKNIENSCIVISISSTSDSFPEFQEKETTKVLKLKFDDVEFNDGVYFTISDQQAREIADFVKANVDSELCIVHCDAGRSRSAGVAAAIGKYINNDDMFIFGRPLYTPNMNCYTSCLLALMNEECLNKNQQNEIKEKYDWNEKIWTHFNLLTIHSDKEIEEQEVIPINTPLSLK